MVAQLARPDQMRDGEERAEQDAQAGDDDVRDAEEGVLAADHGAGREDEGFLAAVFGYVEVCGTLVLLTLRGGKGSDLRSLMRILYVPATIVSVSFLWASLVNVGSAARRIHTWKASSCTRSGCQLSL